MYTGIVIGTCTAILVFLLLMIYHKQTEKEDNKIKEIVQSWNWKINDNHLNGFTCDKLSVWRFRNTFYVSVDILPIKNKTIYYWAREVIIKDILEI